MTKGFSFSTNPQNDNLTKSGHGQFKRTEEETGVTNMREEGGRVHTPPRDKILFKAKGRIKKRYEKVTGIFSFALHIDPGDNLDFLLRFLVHS